MNYLIKIKLFTFTLVLLSCANEKKQGEVFYAGELKKIMQNGEIYPKISLDTLLADNEHIYALGAISDLKGEVTVIDSKPFNAKVVDDEVEINNASNSTACLLVYASVNNWSDSFEISNCNEKKLEGLVFEQAKKNDVDISKPFPFLITGNVSRLKWHVIDWVEGDTIHTHQKHKSSGKNGELQDEPVTIIGFFSKNHKGKFTHHSSNIHLHFVNDEGSLSGHVDELIIENPVELQFPE